MLHRRPNLFEDTRSPVLSLTECNEVLLDLEVLLPDLLCVFTEASIVEFRIQCHLLGRHLRQLAVSLLQECGMFGSLCHTLGTCLASQLVSSF